MVMTAITHISITYQFIVNFSGMVKWPLGKVFLDLQEVGPWNGHVEMVSSYKMGPYTSYLNIFK